MKKKILPIICILAVCIVVAVILVFSVFAAPTITVNGDDSMKVCEPIVMTVTLSDCEKGTSYGVSVTHSDKLELVSGVMARKDGVAQFDVSTKKGVFGYMSGTTDLNGDVVTLTFKGLEVTNEAQEINVQIIARNGSNEIYNKTVNKSVVISDHTYGEAVVEKQPTESETGLKKQTCSVCGNVKEEVIPAISAQQTVDSATNAPSTDTPSTDTSTTTPSSTDVPSTEKQTGEETTIDLICGLQPVPTDEQETTGDLLGDSDNSDSSSGNYMWIVVLVLVVFAVAGSVVFMVIKKK